VWHSLHLSSRNTAFPFSTSPSGKRNPLADFCPEAQDRKPAKSAVVVSAKIDRIILPSFDKRSTNSSSIDRATAVPIDRTLGILLNGPVGPWRCRYLLLLKLGSFDARIIICFVLAERKGRKENEVALCSAPWLTCLLVRSEHNLETTWPRPQLPRSVHRERTARYRSCELRTQP
jgi:hypothetical protein